MEYLLDGTVRDWVREINLWVRSCPYFSSVWKTELPILRKLNVCVRVRVSVCVKQNTGTVRPPPSPSNRSRFQKDLVGYVTTPGGSLSVTEVVQEIPVSKDT